MMTKEEYTKLIKSGTTCIDCFWYREKDVPSFCGCGECHRFPPGLFGCAERRNSDYPLISEYNEPCGEFLLEKRTQP